MMPGKKTPELKFPREWEYRLFCPGEMADGLKARLEQFFRQSGRSGVLRDGNASSGGKYRTVIVSMTVQNKDEAGKTGETFSAFPEVRFML